MGSFVTGDALQSTIKNMEEMGFERTQIMRALKASYNNPDRAVEYLMNVSPMLCLFVTQSYYLCIIKGIPSDLEAESSNAGLDAAAAAAAPSTPSQATPAAPPAAAQPPPAAAPAQAAAPVPAPTAASRAGPQNLFQVRRFSDV